MKALWGASAMALVLAGAAAAGQTGPGAATPSAQEQQVMDLTNQARSEHGLPALKWDPSLTQAARAHAQLMVRNAHLDHQFPGEPGLMARASQAGAHFSAIAENIALGPSANAIAKQWMQSQAHRTNILDPQMNAIGVGVIENSGTLYAVEDFANGVEQMTREQVEQKVGALLRDHGVEPTGPADDARQACMSDSGPAPNSGNGTKPATVARWQTADISKLPDVIEKQLQSGSFKTAAVGACPAQTSGQGFTVYRIAVLLY
jgi:uncharacterized protein YkwD